MTNLRIHEIKREKKKKLFLQEISTLVNRLSADEPAITQVYVTRVDFSADCGFCYVYFSTYGAFSQEKFDEALECLKLYKPSMRKFMAKAIPGRYAPDLKFFYDETKEKEFKIHSLLDKVSEELEAHKED